MLLDEPLANLDVHLRAAMEREFARFHERTGTTMIYITHDQTEAMALADRIAVMDEGRVLQFATPSQLYREPADATVAKFIGEGMVVPVDVATWRRERAMPKSSATACACVAAPGSEGAVVACLRADRCGSSREAPAGSGAGAEHDLQGGHFRVEARVAADRTSCISNRRAVHGCGGRRHPCRRQRRLGHSRRGGLTHAPHLYGGFGEKGRTCLGVESAGYRVLLDAGVKTSARGGGDDYYPAISPPRSRASMRSW